MGARVGKLEKREKVTGVTGRDPREDRTRPVFGPWLGCSGRDDRTLVMKEDRTRRGYCSRVRSL